MGHLYKNWIEPHQSKMKPNQTKSQKQNMTFLENLIQVSFSICVGRNEYPPTPVLAERVNDFPWKS